MTEQNPRERLAAAVKALDAAKAKYDAVYDACRYGRETVNMDAWREAEPVLRTALGRAERETLLAARALLAAPDEAAELRAVKALMEWAHKQDECEYVIWSPPFKTVGNHPPFECIHAGEWRIAGGPSAPTAVELAAKLGIEVGCE